MAVQETSLVDQAANLRHFVIVKALERKAMPNAPLQKLALKLPEAAKQGIMDGLSSTLDKLTAIATMVGEADVDPAAAVPPDLGMALKQAAEVLTGLADQFAPAEATDEGAPPEQTPPPEMEGKGAEPTPPASAMAAAPAQKDLPPPETDSLKVTSPISDGLSLAPKTMSAVAMLSGAITGELTNLFEQAKAGRKIAGNRYKKLSDLHDTLGKLLNELAYDESVPAELAAPAKKAAPAPGDSPILKQLAAIEATLKNQGSQITTLAKSAQVPSAPRAHPMGGGGGAPQSKSWPLDMSAEIDRKRRAAR